MRDSHARVAYVNHFYMNQSVSMRSPLSASMTNIDYNCWPWSANMEVRNHFGLKLDLCRPISRAPHECEGECATNTCIIQTARSPTSLPAYSSITSSSQCLRDACVQIVRGPCAEVARCWEVCPRIRICLRGGARIIKTRSS